MHCFFQFTVESNKEGPELNDVRIIEFRPQSLLNIKVSTEFIKKVLTLNLVKCHMTHERSSDQIYVCSFMHSLTSS